MNKIVAIAGMPGAGKSMASNVACEMGYHMYSMGDVVRGEAKRLGLEATPANLGMIALELRQKNGPSVIARMLAESLMKDDSDTVVVEGVRSMDEVREFQRHFKVSIIAVICSQQIRYQRLNARGRSDDPKDIVEFNERDEREIRLGISQVINSADRHVSNEADEKTFRRRIRRVLKELASAG